MSAPKFRDVLVGLGACEESLDWVGDRTLEQAWAGCSYGDWMLWLAAMVLDCKVVAPAACDCARSVLHLVPAGEDRPRIAIETVEAWCRGEATRAEVIRAYANAQGAKVAASATSATSAAATYAATSAAAYVADADDVDDTYAARAAADVAIHADDALAGGQDRTAEIVRARIPVTVIAAALESR